VEQRGGGASDEDGAAEEEGQRRLEAEEEGRPQDAEVERAAALLVSHATPLGDAAPRAESRVHETVGTRFGFTGYRSNLKFKKMKNF